MKFICCCWIAMFTIFGWLSLIVLKIYIHMKIWYVCKLYFHATQPFCEKCKIRIKKENIVAVCNCNKWFLLHVAVGCFVNPKSAWPSDCVVLSPLAMKTNIVSLVCWHIRLKMDINKVMCTHTIPFFYKEDKYIR